MGKLLSQLQAGGRTLGFQVSRARNTLMQQRTVLLKRERISLVLDVGANTGQYVREIRASGYRGRIAAFEPLTEAFQLLRSLALRDRRLEARRMALGSRDCSALMHVSRNLSSSSLLPVAEAHLRAAPVAAVSHTEEVPVRRLDSLRRDVLDEADRAYLKIDAQGYEKEVLLGAQQCLEQIRAVEVELSLVPLYQRQPLWTEVGALLVEHGFACIWLEREVIDPHTGYMLQCNGLFTRL